MEFGRLQKINVIYGIVTNWTSFEKNYFRSLFNLTVLLPNIFIKNKETPNY